jgi:hypothetical protein
MLPPARLISDTVELGRCQNEGDWLRQEIRHAIDRKRNIVPILARGFQMPLPQALPPDIAELPKFNGLTPAHELFEASIDRLVSTFLKAGKKGTTAASGATQDTMPAATESQGFARLFAERPDVIAEIEAEASLAPVRTVAEFEKLLVRLEVQVCEPRPPSWTAPEDQAHGERLLTLIDRLDADLEEAKAFVATSRQSGVSYDEWHERLQRYQRASGERGRIRSAIAALGVAVVPLVCLSFRRFDASDAFHATCDGFEATWRMDIELAKVMSQLRDLRALPFLADAILRHADDVNGHNDWGLGIVRAVQAFGVDHKTVDGCFQRLVGVAASEVLREKRDREAH